jgi:hypothetical protein
LELPVIVGGRSALELQGYAHYLPQSRKEVHLYGPKQPPNWLFKLPLDGRFVWHNDHKLFDGQQFVRKLPGLNWKSEISGDESSAGHAGVTVQPWGQWNWPLALSTPERAVLELLDELPGQESFHQVDKLMEGLSNLNPRQLQTLLANCKSVKVKRLFFFFADRRNHAWKKRLKKEEVDFGKGKRMLVKGGKLNHAYQITVPEDLDGLSRRALKAVVDSAIFDERFYLMTYPDIAEAGVDPFEHYLAHGRFEKRKPSARFDPAAYAEVNPDAATIGMEPFLHYVLIGRAAGAPLSKAETILPRPELTRKVASGTKRLIIILTPGRDVRVGGVLSIAAIFKETEALTELHRAKVALCAVPGDDPLFLKYSWFENSNYLLDIEAVLRSCENLDYLQLHIPEYAVNFVSEWLTAASSSLLRNVREIHLNIMLQNIDYIEGQNIAALKRFGTVTATTAHDAYGTIATREALGIAVHKLSVCCGPELYKRTSYRNKKPILVVSHDEHPRKDEVLWRIARAHPQLEISVVNNLSYEEYKALISRAKWALSFGEGLDGYFAETIFSGGNSFAVFNERFFTPAFAALETVYPSWEVLQERMPVDLQRLDGPIAYDRCWREAYDLLTSLYSTDRFRENLRAFYRGQYTFP